MVGAEAPLYIENDVDEIYCYASEDEFRGKKRGNTETLPLQNIKTVTKLQNYEHFKPLISN